MLSDSISRRAVLGRLMASAALAAAPVGTGRAWAAAPTGVRLSDGTLTIDFDAMMQSRVSHGGKAITPMAAGEALFFADHRAVDRFLLLDHRENAVAGPHGPGRRHQLRATAGGAVEQQLAITFFDRYPGFALYEMGYRNTGTEPLAIAGWRVATHDLLAHPDGAWSFAGASYPDRRDWVQKVAPGFEQRNFMGMNGSDYGGGTPVAVVWRRDVGLAVGHVETVPRLVSLPVAAQPDGTRLGLSGDEPTLLAPGATVTLPAAFLMAHTGDHFRPLDTYRRVMGERAPGPGRGGDP